ncbi:MAG: CheR family methyltransferase [Deltaproteobacteria bacterium]
MAKARADRQPQRRKGEIGVEQILERIRDTHNLDFRNYKRPTLHRRIERRMSERKCASAEEYLRLLDGDSTEYDALIDSLLIKVTTFFRDPEIWEELSRKLVPRMLSEKRPGEDIRVWCAGCATGEEAFTAAIMLGEAMGDAFHNQDVKVFGTDTDESAIAFARRGLYAHDRLQAVPEPILKNWFVREPGGWAVRKELRRSVVFGVNNLVSDPPISRLDLLICRNVFIYMDAALQRRVLTRFHYAVRRHGILVLGKSELIPFAAKLFESVDLHRRIYRKDGEHDLPLVRKRALSLIEQESLARVRDEGRADPPAANPSCRDAVDAMRTPVIATALDGTVRVWNAAAAMLWGRSEAEVSGRKLAGLALGGLSGDLLIEKSAAVRDGRSEFERSTAVVTRPSDQRALHLAVEVTPLRDAGGVLAGLLYVAYDVTAFRELEAELRKANEDRQTALEELQTSNEELQSANEEMETTNEELQSANEELQTTNEEFQSTNEELQTTNEELQSTNAELDGTNRELAQRTEEMNAVGHVQRTIIRSLNAAVLVLDEAGTVRSWNLAAERLLGISEDEAVGQVLWTLHVPALPRPTVLKMRKALGQGAPLRAEQVSYELPNGSQGRATLVAAPVVEAGRMLGAVVIFEDTTRLANLASELTALKAEYGGKRNQSN